MVCTALFLQRTQSDKPTMWLMRAFCGKIFTAVASTRQSKIPNLIYCHISTISIMCEILASGIHSLALQIMTLSRRITSSTVPKTRLVQLASAPGMLTSVSKIHSKSQVLTPLIILCSIKTSCFQKFTESQCTQLSQSTVNSTEVTWLVQTYSEQFVQVSRLISNLLSVLKNTLPNFRTSFCNTILARIFLPLQAADGTLSWHSLESVRSMDC